MNKYLLYRICSLPNSKPRHQGFSKMECLENLIQRFPGYRVVCIADNCDDGTVEVLRAKNFYFLGTTSLGQTESFRYLIRYAIDNLDDQDLIYIVEDDYWHMPLANEVLEEGLRYFDYVSLYDHPDKYGGFKEGSNPYVDPGHLSELTQVLIGEHVLWRTTNSTTHTFSCFLKTLKEDSYVWLGKISRRNFLHDFYDWTFLTKPGLNGGNLKLKYILRQCIAIASIPFGSKKRTLGIPVPSKSAHLEVNLLPNGFYLDDVKPPSKLEPIGSRENPRNGVST